MVKKLNNLFDSFFRYKPSTRLKYTLGAAIIVGILAHLYIYTNRIVNHDGVFALTYSGSTISSGRWFLYILSEIAYIFTNNYVTPWGIGAVTIALYGIAACTIVLTFDLKNKWLCAALSGLIVSFPTVTSNNLYIFTAHYYALAFLLACLSVYFVNKKVNILNTLISGILLMLSLGIYQGYLPFALSMYVSLVIFRCLRSETKPLKIFLDALGFVGAVLLGLISYLVANRLSLKVFGFQMETYMGMDSMGSIDLAELPHMMYQCYYNFFNLFRIEYCGINHRGWLRKVMLLCVVYFVAVILYQIIKKKIDWRKLLLAAGALLVFPIAINAMYIMVHVEKGINTMTTFATIFVFLCPILISDQLPSFVPQKSRRVIWLCLLFITSTVTWYYSNLANETYLSLEYSNRNVDAYYTGLATQIKSLDNFSPDLKVAFVGEINDKNFPEINCDYIIRGTFTPKDLANVYSRKFFMSMHCGYSCEFVDDTAFLAEDPRVQDMPCYPSAGSIQIIDDMVVVKFS